MTADVNAKILVMIKAGEGVWFGEPEPRYARLYGFMFALYGRRIQTLDPMNDFKRSGSTNGCAICRQWLCLCLEGTTQMISTGISTSKAWQQKY